jgi:hypothetical protein
MVECDRHGLSFGSRCCGHVAVAIDEGLPLAARVFVDGMTDPHQLCPACVEPVETWLSEYRRGAQSMLEPDYSMNGRCVECMLEWYSATGLGDLSIAVKRAREDRLKIEQERGA